MCVSQRPDTARHAVPLPIGGRKELVFRRPITPGPELSSPPERWERLIAMCLVDCYRGKQAIRRQRRGEAFVWIASRANTTPSYLHTGHSI